MPIVDKITKLQEIIFIIRNEIERRNYIQLLMNFENAGADQDKIRKLFVLYHNILKQTKDLYEAINEIYLTIENNESIKIDRLKRIKSGINVLNEEFMDFYPGIYKSNLSANTKERQRFFEEYDKIKNMFLNLINKTINLIDSLIIDINIKNNPELQKNIKNFIDIPKLGNKKGIININGKKINLVIKPFFNLDTIVPSGFVESIHNKVEIPLRDYLQQQVEFLEYERRDHINLKKLKDIDIIKQIIELIWGAVNNVIRNNIRLFKENYYNLIINIVPEKSGLGEAGEFYPEKSSHSFIFINLVLTREALNNYLRKEPIIIGSQLYLTILHELTHAYDWKRLISKKEYDELYNLLKEEPFPETVLLMNLFFTLRAEAITEISEVLFKDIDKNEPIVIIFGNREHKIAKETFEVLFEKFKYEINYEEMWQEIQKLSSEGHIHKYAQYIAIILLIYRLQNFIEVFTIWGNYDQPGYVDLIKKGQTDVGLEKIKINEIGKLLFVKPIYIKIKKEFYEKVKQIITSISLMDVMRFYQSFVYANAITGIGNMAFHPRIFSELNNAKHQQFDKLINEGLKLRK